MDWNDCCHWPAAATTDEFARLVGCAILFQVLAQFQRVHVVGALVDVDEFGKSSSLRDSFRGGNEGVRHGYDNVAGLHPAGHNGETQRIGTAADGNAMACAAECRKCLFEIFDHRTTNESGSVQNLVENGGEFLLHFNVRSNQIKERNTVFAVRSAHFRTSVICSM